MIAPEPLGALNRDPNDLVLIVGGRLLVNHLLEHHSLSGVQLGSLSEDLDRLPLTRKEFISNGNPPIVGTAKDSATRRTLYGTYGGAHHPKHNPKNMHNLPVLKRITDRVLETAKKSVVGGVGLSCIIHVMAKISGYDHTPQHLHRYAPPYTIPEDTLIVNCLIMLTHNHEAEEGSQFAFHHPALGGSLTLGCRGLCPSRGALHFFFNASDVAGGRSFQRPRPLV